MSGTWMVAVLIGGVFVIGFGVAAFIAWWTYTRSHKDVL